MYPKISEMNLIITGVDTPLQSNRVHVYSEIYPAHIQWGSKPTNKTCNVLAHKHTILLHDTVESQF